MNSATTATVSAFGTAEGPPPRNESLVPIVGIGGSAGGIAAVSTFLGCMPADSGVAVVIILHLSPTHESTLAALFQRTTALKVVQAETGQKVEANCAYVIPPGKHLVLTDGHLKLNDLPPVRERLVAIDTFFRTLADTHGGRAVAVLVSGADADGSSGIKRIKECGGLTIAQKPAEAAHPEMPRSAIATGLIDWVLEVKKIAPSILQYFRLESQMNPPPEQGPHPAQPLPVAEDERESALRAILDFLRSHTGRDFSYYKRATIVRRISRRAQVNGFTDFREYAEFLRGHPEEIDALSQDLLISVTNFFRDAEAFRELERQLPALFRHKGATDTVRVWVAGCATGEEAYSIAMLLCEHARLLEQPPKLQIFATDLAEDAVNYARQGQYPDTIVADVSTDRLERFFIPDGSGHRIRKEIRDLVLFAKHDLLKDPPFSKLDFVSCRNLLIYLDRSAQLRVFETFYFALKAEGLLLLGSSESLSDESVPFTVIDKKHRLYSARRGTRSALPSLPFSTSDSATGGAGSSSRPGRSSLLPPPSRERSYSDLYFKLLDQLGPAAVLINREHELLYLSKGAGRYFRFGEGEPSKNALITIHPLLRPELRRVLFEADRDSSEAVSPPMAIEIDGKVDTVTVRSLAGSEFAPGVFLVTFETTAAGAPGPPRGEATPDDSVTQQLEYELEMTRNQSREAVEQYETSAEELRASNEELQSMNEEMRAATEELEMGREELQSTNEELGMVNLELKSKVDELAQTNGDLHNLIGATQLATVFLDNEVRITRYTPSALSLFNLIPTDLGRPFSDMSHRLVYPNLEADARKVLASLAPFVSEVKDTAGHWYLARVLPYRTPEDRIGGIVLTFVDISAQKADEAALRAGEGHLRAALGQVMMAQENERSRISKGLHDVVGQEIAAVSLGLKELEKNSGGGTGEELIRELHRRLETIGEEIHDLALELRPTALDELGLMGTLAHYLTDWSKKTGVAVEIHTSGLEKTRLPAVLEVTLYRIIREALHNVAKHAQAKRLSLIVERRPNQAVAIIEDDGVGFDPGPGGDGLSASKLGLIGMKERALIVGGRVEIESHHGRGTTLFVRLPLAAPETPSHA